MYSKIPHTPYELYLSALCLWRECRGEVKEGQIAVAWVIRSRVEHPSWWGRNLWGVICQPWQFSSMTAKGDSQTIRFPSPLDEKFLDCIAIMQAVLNGEVENPAPNSDHYYSTSMTIPPKFADETKFVCQIGNHRFYNLEKD